MSTWFTADTHFGHAKIIEHSHRPFGSVEEMDDVLVQLWNKRVKANDDVWHLGDFNFRSHRTTTSYWEQLNGRIHMVWGNHDDAFARRAEMIAVRAGLRMFASTQEAKYLRIANEKITLYHYAQRVWRNSHHGAWHLFGHSHNSLPSLGRSMDVGVDARGYQPISFDEVRELLKERELTYHHPDWKDA